MGEIFYVTNMKSINWDKIAIFLVIYKIRRNIKMNIGIIGAMQEEVQFLIRDMEFKRKEVKAKMEFSLGSLHNKNVVVVTSGIGKVNAAI